MVQGLSYTFDALRLEPPRGHDGTCGQHTTVML